MINVIYTYEAKCDFCKKKHRYESYGRPYEHSPIRDPVPDGWKWVSVTAYGSTHYYSDGYSSERLACPSCAKEKTKQ